MTRDDEKRQLAWAVGVLIAAALMFAGTTVFVIVTRDTDQQVTNARICAAVDKLGASFLEILERSRTESIQALQAQGDSDRVPFVKDFYDDAIELVEGADCNPR